MKVYDVIDIYGDVFYYFCENKKDAIECFICENGKDRLSKRYKEFLR